MIFKHYQNTEKREIYCGGESGGFGHNQFEDSDKVKSLEAKVKELEKQVKKFESEESKEVQF